MKGVSLREYFEAVLRERDKAISVALESNEKRLDALNELRGDVATKTQLDTLKERLDRMDGRKEGISVSQAAVGVILSMLISLGGLLLILWPHLK